MRQLIDVLKALGDEARLRAVCSLAAGELCLCQIIDLLELSPSTVSRHMDILFRAGLVERRKEGRWHYFKLANNKGSAEVRQAIRLVLTVLEKDESLAADGKKLCCVKKKNSREMTECYK